MLKVPGLLLSLILFSTCIDPYSPHMDKYKSLLVVEGLITDEKVSFEVRLSRTFPSVNSVPEKINDAVVYITDETGDEARLDHSGEGIYKTDPSLFYGIPGKTYTLHIETSDGRRYVSDPCIMTPVPDIDTIYFSRDEEINTLQNKTTAGIRIYLDTGPLDDVGFFRWEYEEVWKFKPPYPKRFDYISEKQIIKLDAVKEYCWKTNKSGEILTRSVAKGHNYILKEPVLFIPSAESDRLNVQYSILVKQLSISSGEYDFWKKMEQVNETGSDIFGAQPYSVNSNIHNVDDPEENVLGYFKVSAVKTKRLFITAKELNGLDLPKFNYSCLKFVVSPEDYMAPFSPPMTFDDVYDMFMKVGGYTFVEPLINEETKALLKLVFVQNECSDCSLTGSAVKPDFWVDMD